MATVTLTPLSFRHASCLNPGGVERPPRRQYSFERAFNKLEGVVGDPWLEHGTFGDPVASWSLISRCVPLLPVYSGRQQSPVEDPRVQVRFRNVALCH